VIDPAARSSAALYRQIAADLRRRILSGELPPGTLLRAEADLAHDYGVGRNALRAALRVLTAEGLVETGSGRRARVAAQREHDGQVVILWPGDELVGRLATEDDARAIGVEPGDVVMVVRTGVMEWRYPAAGYVFRAPDPGQPSG
jgi:GntR family transcriptional regulator